MSRTYVYDAAGRVAEVKIGGNVVGSYVYDAANLRTQKTASSIVTHYVYGRGGKLYGEYDNTGSLIREYVYLHGQPLAQVGSGEVLSYLHTDHLGTPRYASNTSGTQVWAWSSDAFGNGTPTGTATVNLRFAGQYWDAESGLHYNWNRYYDPTTGRYISSDPIGLAGGLNTYAYASANPVMFVDPEGLLSIDGVIIDIVAGGLDKGVKGIIKMLTPRKQCPYNPDSVLNNTADEGEKAEGAEEDSASDTATGGPNDNKPDDEDEPASEKEAKKIGRQIEKDMKKAGKDGKDAKRKFHDKKRSGEGDRSKKQLKEDAQDIYEDAGIPVPESLK